MPDLLSCKDDCATIKTALDRYNVTDTCDGLYWMEDPDQMRIKQVKSSLLKKLRNNPKEKILIVFVLAGHGMQMSGKQVLLINEFNKYTGFYKFWGIEE